MSEGILEIVIGIELIKWNEIADSEHWGKLIDIDLELCFNEEFTQVNERHQKFLHLNKR